MNITVKETLINHTVISGTTEVSNKVYAFLNSGLPKTYIWFSEKIDKVWAKIFQKTNKLNQNNK